MHCGFLSTIRQKRYYPRLICCLTDMKEAWNLWGLKHMSCPLCSIQNKKDYNVMITSAMQRNPKEKRFLKRPYSDLNCHIRHFESHAARPNLQLAISDKIRRDYGHFPVRLAFSTVSTDAWRLYIVDILHQPKKGIFAELLRLLKKWAKQNKQYKTIKQRMKDIRAYIGLEHFKRSWFDVSKITASNYRDIVTLSYLHYHIEI